MSDYQSFCGYITAVAYECGSCIPYGKAVAKFPEDERLMPFVQKCDAHITALHCTKGSGVNPVKKIIVPFLNGSRKRNVGKLQQAGRSEERRVGKECRSEWLRDHGTEKRQTVAS